MSQSAAPPDRGQSDGPSTRYTVFSEIACGGMAMVYLGQLDGGHGFRRSVAIKQMHPQYARDPEFREMFLDEARLVAKIRHPNVVPTLDIVAREGALLIVMEYIEGESVAALMPKGGAIPPRIAAAIVHDALLGLHAAHELKDDEGQLLGVIHRDVSPANVFVGRDGLSRILDFGVAKAAGRSAPTRDGSIKGKVSYMPPEQLWGSELDRTVDTYASAIVLWEILTGKRLFKGDSDAETMNKVVELEVTPPSTHCADAVPLDDVVMKGLSRDPSRRFQTALEMARAIEKALSPAPRLEIAEWLQSIAADSLAQRDAMLRAMQRGEPSPHAASLAPVAEVLTVSRPLPPPTPRSGQDGTGEARYAPDLASTSLPPPVLPTNPRGEPMARPSSTARAVGLAAAGILLVLLTIGGTALTLRRRADVDPPKPSAALPPETTPVATTPPPPRLPGPDAAAPAAPPGSTSSAAPASRPGQRPVTRPPATGKANCTPPWYLDAQGNKHFKVECL